MFWGALPPQLLTIFKSLLMFDTFARVFHETFAEFHCFHSKELRGKVGVRGFLLRKPIWGLRNLEPMHPFYTWRLTGSPTAHFWVLFVWNCFMFFLPSWEKMFPSWLPIASSCWFSSFKAPFPKQQMLLKECFFVLKTCGETVVGGKVVAYITIKSVGVPAFLRLIRKHVRKKTNKCSIFLKAHDGL